jgi:hypothetical protein
MRASRWRCSTETGSAAAEPLARTCTIPAVQPIRPEPFQSLGFGPFFVVPDHARFLLLRNFEASHIQVCCEPFSIKPESM